MDDHAGRWIARALALGLLAQVPVTARADWPHDPFVNVPLSTSYSPQIDAAVAADGAGGAIVVWCDGREYPAVMCAQRVSADGAVLWDPAGVVISYRGPLDAETSHGDLRAVIVPDGAGGVIVAWGAWSGWDPTLSDRANIVAQRVTADGAAMWGPNGVNLCNAPGFRDNLTIATDGEGGAILAWDDQRFYTLPYYDPDLYESDIFAQKVSADGIAQWAPDGEVVFVGAGVQRAPAVAGDGAGGAFITWREYDATAQGYILRAQRLAASGGRQWAVDGVVFSACANTYRLPIVEDGAGGAIASWREDRAGVDVLLAQRLGPAGTMQWPAGGVPLGGTCRDHLGPAIAPDGDGGAIVAWQDYRGLDVDIYAQRVSADGSLLWTPGSVPVVVALGDQGQPIVAADGAGGVLVTWTSPSNSQTYGNGIFAQRVTAMGDLLWSRGGAAICLSGGCAQYPCGIVGDGAGGAVLAWTTGWHAVAQGIDAEGATFRSEPVIASVRDISPDQGGRVRIRWSASNLDRPAAGMATYGVWRQVSAAKDGAPRWESLGTVMARGETSYTFTASTFADSCAAGSASSTFMVDYHLLAWGDSWESIPAAGCSVDNLAPARPANVRLASGWRLAWDTAVEPDFRQYTVYGSPVAYLDANATVVERTTNNSLDIGGLAYPYLLVTASDIHDNESGAGAASALSGVDVSSPTGLRLQLFPAHPNPFNPRTSLAFTLPQAGVVRITIFDLAGRAVRTLVDASLPPGRHEADWDGRDAHGRAVGSGSYVARLECDGRVQVTRLELVR